MNLSMCQFMVLGYLSRAGRSFGAELSRELGYATGSLYPGLKRLMLAGFVASEREDIEEWLEGRRARVYYWLTEDGARAFQQQREAVLGVLS